MYRTKNEVLMSVTHAYLDELDMDDVPEPKEIEQQLLDKVATEFRLENAVKQKGETWRIPDSLNFAQIADILVHLYPIYKINCAGSQNEEYDILAIYQDSGINKGIYVTNESEFRKLARSYKYDLTSKEFNEIMDVIKDRVPRRTRNRDRDLIAVNNGIFNYATKTLEDFDPDIVFLTKSRVDYNPVATNVVIHNDEDGTDWDVESWMESLSDDPEIVNLLWEILGAIIRPNVRWNKSAWMYSEKGNNGKGTLCELMRSLCGEDSYASISIADFSKDFLLEPLIRASAVIVDENDVGSYIDKAANLKAVITNDVIQINRKFKQPIAYQFYGFMVQCLNEYPRIKDKSDSFYRRQLFIPMEKCFTGRERKYIKTDYLHRPEVLEYVLQKVLHMDYYTLSEPQRCLDVLSEYKQYNDPVRQFWDEFESEFAWDLLPFSFLYDLYKAWFSRNAPSGGIQGRNTFISDILNVIDGSSEWYCIGKSAKVRTGHAMDKPEPLIMTYGLKGWMNATYNGKDVNLICSPKPATGYRGLSRYTTGTDSTDDDADSDSDDE